jgi:hypothetical protein
MDDMTDDAPLDSTDGQQVAAGAVRHLTYGQIGERFGMSADAARQLVRRRGWCRSRPNAIGQPVVVGVPEAELTGEHPRPTTDDESPDIRRMINGAPLDDRPPPLENNGEFDDSDRRSVLSVTVGALRSAVGLLGQQLEAERRRADAAQAQVEGLHRDLTAAEAAAREARRALEAARQEATEAQASADLAQAAQGEAQADAAEMHVRLGTIEARAKSAEEAEQAERKRADTAVAELRQAEVSAHEAVRAAEELRQADAARRGQGRWQRLRAAWRGD